ncbi:MAG TPA: S-methyl-5-thioribose-1-phosphate isomerase [Bacteroidales bacterium]|jgi:methylthioribose-1-phosphate isomerase|nr:S-methyl-5-thioribose-1-phosphate isomerase [Bacteroidales bacterium]HNR42420.1 S-methyl-5-thioribose-1-phosphate isomerase [Bacteroidales bacterium]HQG78634.1 S-methyl-5-thioribose-1-phosphate isomerase [Bacteroidales bacterium]
MRVGKEDFQSIWPDESDPAVIKVIDQRKLPFTFEIKDLRSVEDVYEAIENMTVRGAPLIGAAAAFGLYLALLEATPQTNLRDHLLNASRYLISCRPTAVNLSWAVNHSLEKLLNNLHSPSVAELALQTALDICETEKEYCKKIGEHGVKVLEELARMKNGAPVNILTHCNAGWLATIDYGTATAPVYLAHDKGIPLHVWVDETRPRNQGSRLTAWELGQNGIRHSLITDNTGGYLMQKKMVDVVMVGSDRTTSTGDVANKIGTYLKALAAHDNNIPFYVLFPSTTFDFSKRDGIGEIEIEERDPEEVTSISGFSEGTIKSVTICPENTAAANYGFDITPARLITGLITERGICRADENEIKKLFSDKLI